MNTLREYLLYLKDSGVQEVWGPDSFPFEPRPVAATQAEPEMSEGASPEPAPGPVVEGTSMSLDEIRARIGDCKRCKLHSGRTNLVFGVGDPHAKIMFVGEGPGRDEDLQGEPFVGRAGQLLTDMIEKSAEKLGIAIKRKDVYIANIVKCRPPENRNPEEDEIAACEGFLKEQIEAIRPRVICALGKFAAQTLLKSKTPIGRLRGNVYEYNGIKLIPTFHPAYLLRRGAPTNWNPEDRRMVWEDMKMLYGLYEGLNPANEGE